MRTYSQVYNQSKKEVLDARQAVFEKQKIAVTNVLKEEYIIRGKISEMSKKDKEMMMKRLLEYWNPKTGLNAAGVKLLNENVITLSKDSNKEDLKLFINKQTKKNLDQIIECFRLGRQDIIVESFNDEVKQMTGRTLKADFILDTVWGLVGRFIKGSVDTKKK